MAAAISKIAQWEWPENWTGLFDILVNSLNGDNTHAVHGAMRVLTEFSRDLTDTQLPTVGSVILQEMLRILSNDTVSITYEIYSLFELNILLCKY